MRIVSEIGDDGLRCRPVGVQHDTERMHVRCVLITLVVIVSLCLQISLRGYIWEQNQMYVGLETGYMGDDGVEGPMTLDDVQEFQDSVIRNLVYGSTPNVDSMIGRPRVRLLYVKNMTCLYPVKHKTCYRRLDFSEDFEELDRNRTFEAGYHLEGVRCPPHLDATNITLEYTPDAELGNLDTQACFNCKYPLDGYVLDIPRPNLTLQSIHEYHTDCLLPLSSEIFRRFVDESTRLLQIEFNLYNPHYDLFMRFTVAYEEFDLNRWWPLYRIDIGHFLGAATRGNYHGAVDDAKVIIFPTLIFVLLLLRLYFEPKQGRRRRVFLTIITAGLLIWRVSSLVRIGYRYEKVFDTLQSVPSNHSRLGRMEQLMNTEQHFASVLLINDMDIVRAVDITLIIISILHASQYDYYHWHQIMLLMVAIRKSLKYSLPFILYFLMLNFVFATVGHSLFGLCSPFFSEKTDAFIKLIEFQFLGEMDYKELMECAPIWGEVYFIVVSVVMFMILANFTFSYVYGVMTDVRRLKGRQMVLEQRDEMLEKINWPVNRCNRGLDLSLDDQIRLVSLYNILKTSVIDPTSSQSQIQDNTKLDST